jgi:hypothetical protein
MACISTLIEHLSQSEMEISLLTTACEAAPLCRTAAAKHPLSTKVERAAQHRTPAGRTIRFRLGCPRLRVGVTARDVSAERRNCGRGFRYDTKIGKEVRQRLRLLPEGRQVSALDDAVGRKLKAPSYARRLGKCPVVQAHGFTYPAAVTISRFMFFSTPVFAVVAIAATSMRINE